MIIKLLVDGGDMKPGPAIGQKLGPVGINIGKVVQDVNKATSEFSGMKVPVELDIDIGSKDFKVRVSSPPIAELLKKELGIDKASGEASNFKVGNVSIEQIISIAKTKLPNMLSKDLKAAVKTVVGSCVSLGILVECKSAKDVEEEIAAGKYDKEIKEEKSITDPKKREKLDEFFNEINMEQEEKLKKEEEEKKKEEEKKAEEEGKKEESEEEKEEEKKEEKEKK